MIYFVFPPASRSQSAVPFTSPPGRSRIDNQMSPSSFFGGPLPTDRLSLVHLLCLSVHFSRQVMNNMFVVMRSMIRIFFLYTPQLTIHWSTRFSYSNEPAVGLGSCACSVDSTDSSRVRRGSRFWFCIPGSSPGRFRNCECCQRDDQLLSRLVESCAVS